MKPSKTRKRVAPGLSAQHLAGEQLHHALGHYHVVRRDTSKTSLSLKLKRAGWDESFLRKLLTNISTA